MQFVVSAMAAGRKAAVYMFDEILETLIERVEKLCLMKEGGLRAYIAEGQLHAQQVDPAEMSPGAFAHEVRRAVEGRRKSHRHRQLERLLECDARGNAS